MKALERIRVIRPSVRVALFEFGFMATLTLILLQSVVASIIMNFLKRPPLSEVLSLIWGRAEPLSWSLTVLALYLISYVSALAIAFLMTTILYAILYAIYIIGFGIVMYMLFQMVFIYRGIPSIDFLTMFFLIIAINIIIGIAIIVLSYIRESLLRVRINAISPIVLIASFIGTSLYMYENLEIVRVTTTSIRDLYILYTLHLIFTGLVLFTTAITIRTGNLHRVVSRAIIVIAPILIVLTTIVREQVVLAICSSIVLKGMLNQSISSLIALIPNEVIRNVASMYAKIVINIVTTAPHAFVLSLYTLVSLCVLDYAFGTDVENKLFWILATVSAILYIVFRPEILPITLISMTVLITSITSITIERSRSIEIN